MDIINLTPTNTSYKNAPTTSIAFTITGAGDYTGSDISVVINGKDAIRNGMYYNGYDGAITPSADTFIVSIIPPYHFPPFVGYTISIGGNYFNYSFRTTLITTTMLITSQNITKLYSTEMLILAATDNGLDVIDKRTLQNIAHITRTGGFTSLWAKIQHLSTDCIYLGTASTGVFKIALSDVMRGGDVSSYCSSKFTDYTTPALSSPIIIDLHGYGDSLAILTPNNVNYISSELTVARTTLSGTISYGRIKASLDDVYYTGPNGLNTKYSILGDWVTPDFVYSTTSTPAIGSNTINDLYIADATREAVTSLGFGNSIFIATSNGAWIIQEDKGAESTSSVVSYGQSGKTYNVLDSDICTIILADKMVEYKSGHIFIGDITGKVYFININTNLAQFYHTDSTGSFEEVLASTVLQSVTSI